MRGSIYYDTSRVTAIETNVNFEKHKRRLLEISARQHSRMLQEQGIGQPIRVVTPGQETRIKLFCRNSQAWWSRQQSAEAKSMDFATPVAVYNLPEQEIKVVLYEKPKPPKPYSAAFHLKERQREINIQNRTLLKQLVAIEQDFRKTKFKLCSNGSSNRLEPIPQQVSTVNARDLSNGRVQSPLRASFHAFENKKRYFSKIDEENDRIYKKLKTERCQVQSVAEMRQSFEQYSVYKNRISRSKSRQPLQQESKASKLLKKKQGLSFGDRKKSQETFVQLDQ